MIPGITGSLLSSDALEREIPDVLREHLDERGADAVRRRISAWHRDLRTQLGPSAAARAVFDRLAAPLFSRLGYRILPVGSTGDLFRGLLQSDGAPVAVLLVTGWGHDISAAWREAVTHGIGYGVRWSLCLSGPLLRVMDSVRTYSRRHLEFDLQLTVDNERAFAVLWGLLRAAAMAGPPGHPHSVLERAIEISERHRAAIRNSLQSGVHDALQHLLTAFVTARARPSRRLRPCPALHEPLQDSFQESLVVVYRILFLLFAEARGLVPHWHPVYRDGYTIESLRGPVEMLPRPRGLWETLQAMARLAHRGCRAGSLRVPPFNGRLFSPAHAPLADTLPLDDGAVRQALLSLTTRPARYGRERIAYSDLGVEQLGGIYERLLEYEPAAERRVTGPALVPAERRRATGSFYTPRSLTEFLVRRTLAPLVHDAAPDRILALRVVDPAMGSGAFLVAACRYLAGAYELALVRESGISASEISDADRAEFRRAIAQRCLYGVDVNPMAVQLGRLSLWLATLAADKPLTFLDHRLRAGNSLVGVSPADIGRQPYANRTRRHAAALPLFPADDFDRAIGSAIEIRAEIATGPGDTLEQVRAKERALAALVDERSKLTAWKQVGNVWCAGWFCPARDGARLRSAFTALTDRLLKGTCPLPDQTVDPLLDGARRTADRERFFHWSFEFPEVFYDAKSQRWGSSPGFDAIIGNPPWEMLRGDRGDVTARSTARAAASQLSEFSRSSGIYRLQSGGHANLYQLFLERALALVRPNGRLGLLLPWGLTTDQGCAHLRRALMDRTEVDTFVGVENRDGLFPIHRRLKFVLMTATAGGRTSMLPCRFGVRRADALDALPDMGRDPNALPAARALLERVSGPQLAIPEVRSREDVGILTSVAFTIPALGDLDGWNVHFGRELNATEDRKHFTTAADGIPILDGKHITPFAVDASAVRFRMPAQLASRLLDPARTYGRERLGYRDVASATNRLTLIASVIPKGMLTTHTLFCLKEHLDLDAQLFLCGIFNSFAANYLIRLRVSTHVSASIVDRLPVPKPAADSIWYREVVRLAAELRREPRNSAAVARLNGLVAHVYGLRQPQLQHLLDTFPLIPRAERDAAIAAFCDIERQL
jgi:hypothetical protein